MTKIGTEVAHVTHESDTTFKVKRSKVNLQGAYCGGLPLSFLNSEYCISLSRYFLSSTFCITDAIFS